MTTFVNDTFTDTNLVALASHTGETGATWTLHPSYSSGTAFIDANRVRPQDVNVAYYASGVPGVADYYVEAPFFNASAIDTNTGICARMSTSADTMYYLRWNGLEWQLYRDVAGVFTLLGTFAETFSVSSTRTVRLDVVTQDGSTVRIKCYFDTILQIDYSDTDASRITAAGRVGWMARNNPTTGAGQGVQLASITAVDTVSDLTFSEDYGSFPMHVHGEEHVVTVFS
jgi:hypothetical protein